MDSLSRQNNNDLLGREGQQGIGSSKTNSGDLVGFHLIDAESEDVSMERVSRKPGSWFQSKAEQSGTTYPGGHDSD